MPVRLSFNEMPTEILLENLSDDHRETLFSKDPLENKEIINNVSNICRLFSVLVDRDCDDMQKYNVTESMSEIARFARDKGIQAKELSLSDTALAALKRFSITLP